MRMNVYYDRIKRSLTFFEKSILVNYALGNVCFRIKRSLTFFEKSILVNHALGNVCFLYSICGQLYAGFCFIVHRSHILPVEAFQSFHIWIRRAVDYVQMPISILTWQFFCVKPPF